MNGKRIALGVLAMLVAAFGLSYMGGLPGPGEHLPDPVRNGLVWLLAALAGGLVARSGFVPPALAVWLIVWAVAAYLLYRIAAPQGQASVAGILSYNATALVVSLAATIGGAALGQWIARRGDPRRPLAPDRACR